MHAAFSAAFAESLACDRRLTHWQLSGLSRQANINVTWTCALLCTKFEGHSKKETFAFLLPSSISTLIDMLPTKSTPHRHVVPFPSQRPVFPPANPHEHHPTPQPFFQSSLFQFLDFPSIFTCAKRNYTNLKCPPFSAGYFMTHSLTTHSFFCV